MKMLKQRGDRAVIHDLRERPLPAPRRLPGDKKEEAIRILSEQVYAGFGPRLAAEYLSSKHGLAASKETLRRWKMEAKLWRGQKPPITTGWQGRGERVYPISTADDATSRLCARFVTSDSTAENMRVPAGYRKQQRRDEPGVEKDPADPPPTVVELDADGCAEQRVRRTSAIEPRGRLGGRSQSRRRAPD